MAHESYDVEEYVQDTTWHDEKYQCDGCKKCKPDWFPCVNPKCILGNMDSECSFSGVIEYIRLKHIEIGSERKLPLRNPCPYYQYNCCECIVPCEFISYMQTIDAIIEDIDHYTPDQLKDIPCRECIKMMKQLAAKIRVNGLTMKRDATRQKLEHLEKKLLKAISDLTDL